MNIEHIALWTTNLEELRAFYMTYFAANSSEKYINQEKGFESYFLAFPSGETRLELMRVPDIKEIQTDGYSVYAGYIHLAISVGSVEKVNELTEKLREDGLKVIGEPRYTGDGYYESVILDPDSNQIEITI